MRAVNLVQVGPWKGDLSWPGSHKLAKVGSMLFFFEEKPVEARVILPGDRLEWDTGRFVEGRPVVAWDILPGDRLEWGAGRVMEGRQFVVGATCRDTSDCLLNTQRKVGTQYLTDTNKQTEFRKVSKIYTTGF